MGFKKKKNIIILTLCMGLCFILYQLYFFSTITAESNNLGKMIITVRDHRSYRDIVHVRSDADIDINEHGIIKGVFYSQMPKYRPDSNSEFTCLKSKEKIPFKHVNDNYCDCEDGTDEPSTSACVNGTFYCDTQYKKKHTHKDTLEIPSGKVNDGICDCCDGSDEWSHKHKLLVSQSNDEYYRYYVTECPNTCLHL